KKSYSKFSPPSSPILKQHTNSIPIHVSVLNRSNNNKLSSETMHIPLFKRPLLRADANNTRRISSSPSPRPLFNDKQQSSS
ncbi:unnamed protein product, partial [Rotaria magnacalcarata]